MTNAQIIAASKCVYAPTDELERVIGDAPSRRELWTELEIAAAAELDKRRP